MFFAVQYFIAAETFLCPMGEFNIEYPSFFSSLLICRIKARLSIDQTFPDKLDVFFKFRIQHARVFAKMENLFGDQFQPDGMMINDYPIPGRVFKIGLSWALFN